MHLQNQIPEQDGFRFPGRGISGISMVLAPVLLLLAELLRIQFDFFYPAQLQAFVDHPTRIAVSYNLFLAGNILLWPAIIALSNLIGKKKPSLALWGGIFVIFGLFARTFHYGINHLAFQLTAVQNLELATKAVGESYGAFHIISTLSAAIMFGWIILAVGAYRSGVLKIVGATGLGLMSALMLGVLKGGTVVSLIATGGLCIALIPLGVQVLRSGPIPEPKFIFRWSLIIIAVVIGMYFFGQAG